MPNSPRTATPTPASSDSPDGPTQMAALVAQLEKFTIPKFADATARTAAIASPGEGDFGYMLDSHKLVRYGPGGVYVSMVTPVFSSAVARDATMTSPAEGDECYRTDTHAKEIYTGSAWVENGKTQGQTGTWTPQVDQGASSNIAKTVNEARYVRIGNLVTAWFTLSVTAAGSAGSVVTLTLPITAVGHTGNANIGSGFYYDASAGSPFYTGAWRLSTTTTIAISTHASTGGWGASPSAAVANGDVISGMLSYLVA